MTLSELSFVLGVKVSVSYDHPDRRYYASMPGIKMEAADGLIDPAGAGATAACAQRQFAKTIRGQRLVVMDNGMSRGYNIPTSLSE